LHYSISEQIFYEYDIVTGYILDEQGIGFISWQRQEILFLSTDPPSLLFDAYLVVLSLGLKQ
jgi:hypothetical protein